MVKTFKEQIFMQNVGARRRDRDDHPLQLSHQDVIDAYDGTVASRVSQALEQGPEATQAEQSVARIAHMSDLPKSTASLVEALKYVFHEGSLMPVDGLLKERAAILDDLAERKEKMEKPEKELSRVFRAFIYAEINALARGTGNPGTLPPMPEDKRSAVQQGLKVLTASDSYFTIRYAWGEKAEGLETALHPERAWSRSRGMGLGM